MKIVITSFMLILSYIQGYTQTFKGGVFGGITTSQINGDKMAGFSKFGPSIGLFVTKEISDTWQAGMEICYNSKGSVGNKGNTKISLAYIEIPVFANYTITEEVSTHAGIAFATKLFENTSLMDIETETNGFGKYDFPIFAGIGYSFSYKSTMQTRFSYSLIPIQNQYYNYCINLSYYYSF